jgi:hypothetical protein
MKLSEFTFDIQHRSLAHTTLAHTTPTPTPHHAFHPLAPRPPRPSWSVLSCLRRLSWPTTQSTLPQPSWFWTPAPPTPPSSAVGYGSAGAPPVEEGGRLEGLGKRKTQAADTKLAQAAGCKNHAAKRLRLSRAVASTAERVIPPQRRRPLWRSSALLRSRRMPPAWSVRRKGTHQSC